MKQIMSLLTVGVAVFFMPQSFSSHPEYDPTDYFRGAVFQNKQRADLKPHLVEPKQRALNYTLLCRPEIILFSKDCYRIIDNKLAAVPEEDVFYIELIMADGRGVGLIKPFLEDVNEAERPLHVSEAIVLPDGRIIINPSREELLKKAKASLDYEYDLMDIPFKGRPIRPVL